MKKILLLLCFLAAFFVSNAQYPVIQYLGRDSSLVDSRGGLKARLINYAFTDTTEANTQRISQYPGAMIYTTSGGDKLWLRSSDATLWTRVGTTSGGGGNGIVSLGTSAYGLIIQNDSTYKVDTNLVSTRLWRKKGVDSVQANLTAGLALKLNITDTANKWITSVYRKTASDSVFYVKGGTATFAYRDSIGSGGGGGGVTTIATINGTTKSSNGAVISGANFYMQTVDGTYPGLMTSAQKARLDSNSYLTIDKRYDSLAWRRNDSTFLIKSLRVQAYGTTQTPTLTDSSFSVNITKAPPTKQSVTSTSDTLHLINDSTTFVGATKIYGYSGEVRGWKDALEMTLTNPSNGDAIIYSSGALVNGRKVDSIYRTAGKDSIIYLISGTRYAIKDSTGGGGGGSAAGNYGNVQLNRNSTFATPASDSLSFTSGSGLNVKGKYLVSGTQVVYLPPSMTGSSVFGDGGGSLSHSSANQGYYNTLVGITAGGTMTTGYMNVGVGWSALGGATMTGWENTALGTGAMYSATSAQQNVAIGKYALFSMTTGLNNIGIGFESLYSNTNSYNIGLGHSAGRLNSSGGENLYIGYFSGYYNQTGSFNTYVGSQAGLGVSTNSNANNVGIGYKNLYAITTGSNNISIGYQAGDALTSGTKNIIIGYDIDAASNSGSNQMTIGNLIFGTDMTGSGTTAAGKMGVLTNAPTAVLDVNSDIIRLRTAKTPASASDTGNAGDIAWDANYIYVCTATNTWKRSAIATW